MKRPLQFLTHNPGKIATAQKELAQTEWEIEPYHIELIEPQADTIEEVVRAKAEQARMHTDRPFIVLDSGLVIPGLGGFPGVYTKYTDATIKSEGMLALVDKICPQTREAYFQHSIIFFDGTQEFIFSDKYMGSIAHQRENLDWTEAWSDFARIFIPLGQTQTLSYLYYHKIAYDNRMPRPVSVWDKLREKLLGIPSSELA